MSTQIIYLTTRCDLDCDYCYEKRVRDTPGFIHKDSTEEMIDSYMLKIPRQDNGVVVLIGGEPFLRFDLIKYTLGKYPNKNYCITTNGISLNRHFNDFFPFLTNHSNLHLQISYDGTGNYRRNNGVITSTKAVLELLDKLEAHDFSFNASVSYTIHRGNKGFFSKDIINLYNQYKKISRYILNICQDEQEVKRNEYEDHVLALRAVIPGYICCYVFCDTCGICKATDSNKVYYFNGEVQDDRTKTELFNHWEQS